jgi:hypothetical protein
MKLEDVGLVQTTKLYKGKEIEKLENTHYPFVVSQQIPGRLRFN